MIDVDLGGYFNMCWAVIGDMHVRRFGRIVNVSSINALSGQFGQTNYAAAKAGLAAFTVALAEEVAHEGILVNAIAPSIMDTVANRKSMPKADFEAWPKVDDVAATVAFLASPRNTVTRGALVPAYGKV